jgi:hypothetical protein
MAAVVSLKLKWGRGIQHDPNRVHLCMYHVLRGGWSVGPVKNALPPPPLGNLYWYVIKSQVISFMFIKVVLVFVIGGSITSVGVL